MTQSQRSRYLKFGGIIVFLAFVLFLLSGGDKDGVKDIVKGMYFHLIFMGES